MIVIAAAILGALSGGTIAARRKGTKADIAQYAFVYALAFSLAGLILSIFLERVIF